MGYSSLVSYVKISPHKNSPRNHKIDTISIHCMAGQLSVENCGNCFQGSRKASSNYGIGPDGRVGLYVDENDRAFCTSSGENDNRAVTIEVASDSSHPYTVKDAAYATLIKLLVDICTRHGIKQLLWKGDKKLIGQIDKQNMTVHRWFSNKACPGDYLYNKHGEIASAVNALLGNPATQTAETMYSSSSVSQGSGNSSLVNYVNRLSAGQYSARGRRISCITVHISRTVGDIYALSQLLNTSEKCYNYGIDINGTIGLFVDETMMSNSSNSITNDDRSVNIVCMNSEITPEYPISDLCYNSLVNLCEDICRRNFIFELKFTGHPESDSLTMHSQFNPKAECPGPYLTKKYEQLMADVNERLASNVGVNFTQVASRLASTESEALKAQSMVAIKAIKPYVLAPDHSALGLNYFALKQIGVVGTMLDAGERFNSHHETVRYRNENIYKQSLEAVDQKMPHAYYYTTRARDEKEVREEAYWFYFILSKYPPKLGIWLRCQFDVKDSVAQELVERWYEFFVDWGLKSKCGLRCTKEQAKKIGWPKQSAYMPLWLEGELANNVCPDDEILTPSFFKLEDLANTGYNINTTTIEAVSSGRYYETTFDAGGTGELITSGSSKTVSGDATEITIPSSPYYSGTKKYEGYRAITNTSTPNYKITHGATTITDSEGFRRVDGRYLIAVGSGICWSIGTYIDVILQNGTVIPCIMGDGKADVHTDAATHIFTTYKTTNYCCSEFIVDTASLMSSVKRTGDCSYRDPSWKSPVAKMKVYSTNWFS